MGTAQQRVVIAGTLLGVLSSPIAHADRHGSRILAGLDITFGTSGPTPEPTGTSTAERRDWLRSFVDSRMGQDSFYDHVLPKLFSALGRKHQEILSATRILQSFSSGAKLIYYLPGTKPCAPEHAVSVRPWWDPAHPAWICPDSFRPAVKQVEVDAQTVYCEASERIPSECGCGEHLLSCWRDRPQRDGILAAFDQEPIRTIQHLVTTRRPLAEILTTNATMRSDSGEFFYARNHFYRTGVLDVPAQRGDLPRLRPRDPEFGGGVLSTPAYLFYDDSQRLVIATIWEDFLCAPLTSMAARAKEMFQPAISTVRVRYHASMDLAAMVGCRDCHARLDNAMEAFMAFSSHNFGQRYTPNAIYPGRIQFYVRGWTDPRGEGPPTLQWLGEMIAAQPEFSACVVHKVEEVVYGGYPVPDEIESRLLRSFREHQDFASLIRDTVVARYVGIEGLLP